MQHIDLLSVVINCLEANQFYIFLYQMNSVQKIMLEQLNVHHYNLQHSLKMYVTYPILMDHICYGHRLMLQVKHH